jgi:hypothetical protein
MIRAATTLVVIGALAAAGCGGEGGKESAGKACGPPPKTLSTPPVLPTGFPSPDIVRYTSTRKEGPSTLVEGYSEGKLDDTFSAYNAAFKSSQFDVTKDEKEENDAEVNFARGDSSGQVKLVQACEGRTSVSITIRPA